MASEREIFDHALTISDARQRAEYLQQACGQDESLREHIEGLLEAHAKLGGFLEKPPLADPDPTAGQPITEGPGAVVGPYKLLQKLGEGGFGVVYMAEQAEPVERRVALKIIKPGMDSRQVISRFKAEEQALAIMDHPNIARVFDAGITGSGRPYFVMELVRGVPITKYCDEQHLTPRQRLELFIPVCHAVQHAHQKGIIHRDLKPSNVLVALYDDTPSPKVIDFGVAKATSQKLAEQTKFTQYGQIVGTLEYMSPEQANLNQLDIDTRSDIYSLGVLLYELLTGETPFDRRRLHAAAFDEILRIIREEEPPRPSLRLSTSETLPSIAANRHIEPKKLSTLVRGELDWIVMKALEKDRSRRYETANALADDIERYLNDEPVVACPPSAAYRFRKFARRNKVPLAIVSAAALILVSVAIGAGVAAARFRDLAQRNADLAAEKQVALNAAVAAEEAATKARDQEAAQRKEAQRQTQIAEGALADVEQQQQRAEGNLDLALAALDAVYLEAIGRDKLLGQPVSQPAKLKPPESEEPPPLSALERELLKRGLRFYDQFAQKNTAAPHAFVQTAQAYYRVGLLQGALGDGAAAAEAYRGAVERFERLAKEEPQNAEYFRQLEEAYSGLAMVVPQWDAAKALFEKSRSAYSRAIELKPDDGLLYLRRAGISGYLGDVGKAAEDSEKALQLDPNRIDALLECSHFHRIGGGDPKRGREYAERAVSLAPDNPKCHLALAESLAFEKCRWIGPGKMRLSDPAPALEHYARAIELAPASPVGYRARGKFYRWIEDNNRALADVNRALEIQPRDRWALKNRGIILARLGQFDKALADLAAHNRFYPHDLAAHRQIVEIHIAMKNWQLAVESMTRILELDPSPWQVLIRRAWAYINLGQHEQALTDLKRALELNSGRVGMLSMSETVRLAAASDEFRKCVLEFARDAVDNSPDRAQALQDRAVFYLGLSEWEKAQADLEKVVASETASHVPHYQHALVCLMLNEARNYRDACAAMARKFGKSDNPMAANFAAWTCALAPDAVDDYGPVLALAAKAVEACPDSDQCLNTLGAILYRAGRHEEAIKWLAELDRPVEGPDAKADSSPAYTWYFLAIVHKKVGNEEKAREYLEKANQATRESLADKENPPVWNRRATLELLRKEAESKKEE